METASTNDCAFATTSLLRSSGSARARPRARASAVDQSVGLDVGLRRAVRQELGGAGAGIS